MFVCPFVLVTVNFPSVIEAVTPSIFWALISSTICCRVLFEVLISEPPSTFTEPLKIFSLPLSPVAEPWVMYEVCAVPPE